MRTKAKESLKRLKALKNKKRKFVSVSELDRETWTECSVLEVRYVSLGDSKTTLRYIELISWANKNCKGNYTRADGSFWFKDKRDAFQFKLKFGEPDGK